MQFRASICELARVGVEEMAALSRLESNAGGGQILMSEATAAASGNLIPVNQRERLTVKNRVQPVTVLEVRWG